MAITGAPGWYLAGLRILPPLAKSGHRSTELFPDDVAVSSSDSVFGVLEGSEDSPESTSSDGYPHEEIDIFDGEVEGDVSAVNIERKKNSWDNRHNLLQATLCRTTVVETGIRNVTKEVLKEIQEKEDYYYCKCGKALAENDCQCCLMREIFIRLRDAGYNSALCQSKWRSSPDVPSGQHTYLDVVENTSPKKGKVRVIIELNFRAEFEMGRASQDYNELINRLPEVFVGKIERLRALVKILCSAAKKCMKDKKMHMGPWRKHKYMQAKWFSPCERLETNEEVDLALSKQAITSSKASAFTMALIDLDVPRRALSVM